MSKQDNRLLDAIEGRLKTDGTAMCNACLFKRGKDGVGVSAYKPCSVCGESTRWRVAL